MRLILNIFKWVLIVSAALILLLFSLSLALSDKVAAIFLKSINDEISTKIEVSECSLTFLRRFPKAAVELRDLRVFSSPTFDKSHFGSTNTDTLLTAAAATLEFSMSDILRGRYNIESITVANGRLNLFSDSSGEVNYDITMSSSAGGDTDEFVIDLERVNVSSVTARYINVATSLDIAGIIKNGRIKSRIYEDKIDFICSSDLVIRGVTLLSTPIKTNASVSLDINLHDSDSGTVIRDGVMKLENFRFGISGSMSSSDVIDLKITGQNIDLAKIKKYMPQEFLDKYNLYSPSGILKSECRIKGLMTRKQNPGVDLSFSVDNGEVKYSPSDIKIKDLSLSGTFTNGVKKSPETWLLSIEKLGFTIGSAQWSGAFRLSDFNHPYLRMTFSGEIKPEELLSFYPVPEILSTGGSFRLNMNLSGRLPDKKSYTLSDLIDMHPEADIGFNSFFLTHKNDMWSVDDIDGNIMFAKNLWAEDLFFTYGGQRFRVNGEFVNLPAWLAGRRVRLRVFADISAGNFNPLLLSGDTINSGNNNKNAFIFPSDIDARIRFRTDNMVYKSFSAENISGVLNYSRGTLDVSDLTINGLGGKATGNFYIIQNKSKSLTTHGSFTFDKIDINQAFRSFNNFGQDFLKAENIAGTLSGNLTILMQLDSLLNLNVKSLTAEGKYVIENGALKNFEPVKELSGFIELSELENITFSKLENDLFIRNNYLAVPQMDIRSSAADFSVNGKHYFDYNYEYHVKVYLSEILSRKAKKNSRYSTEFGPVEEDGLGRTSIFLKLTGNDTDMKVTPDLKATRNNIKQSLKNEKGTLKNILKEEYGWYKGDSTIKSGTSSKPRFRIQFDETDTVSVQNDTIAADEVRGLNSIFKRKKGTGQLN